MLTVTEALKAVEDAAGPPRRRVESVPLADALGRVLSEDVAMDHDVPPFHRATMDGFAVRGEDVPAVGATLRVVGRVMAGATFSRTVERGECVAIMTGAPMPDGADAVVPVERSTPTEGARGAETSVRLAGPLAPRQNVARRAEQVASGAFVATSGLAIDPSLVGVLAAAGRSRVGVAARPQVAILCTGDELVRADEKPVGSQIRDSNGYTLAAQARAAGCDARYGGPVGDDEASLRAAIERAIEGADVLCLSGGVSMGDRDLVPAVFAACGVERRFHRWACKPGGPLWFGVRGDTLVFGLPGNPVAAFVGFEVLAVPALRTRMGLAFRPRATVSAARAGRLPEPIDRRQFVPVDLAFDRESSRLVARPVAWKGSGDPFGLARATGLAVVLETGKTAATTCDAPSPPRALPLPNEGPNAAPDAGSPLIDVLPLASFSRGAW